MGYNRRAVFLKRAAEQIVTRFQGLVPETIEELESLPGIGYNTACAIAAFAYNKPVIYIETNIRSIYIHHFFPRKKAITDEQLLPLVAQTLDRKDPRRWYAALMDYGSLLKKTLPNPSRRSKHHVKQKPFKGSVRQIRGQVLRLLLENAMTTRQLAVRIDTAIDRVEHVVRTLSKEKLIRKKGNKWQLSD
jgi:A/G-specific adenine glycosylase